MGGLGGRLYVGMERSDEGEANHITCGSLSIVMRTGVWP